MVKYIFILIFISAFRGEVMYDDLCDVKNITTQAGEKIGFIVYYNLAGAYVSAGSAVFTNALEKFNGVPVYHITADGKTNSSYEWIYKVHDVYETFMDTVTLMPYKFIRNVNETRNKIFESIVFNRTAKTAETNKGAYKVPACVHDILSAIYSCRNINFDYYKEGDKIPFKVFLDNQLYDMYVRYLEKETIKTMYGTFRSIKFQPLLLEGTIFKGGEKMVVWVSDDRNHIPLRIESPIIVGRIKVDMMTYKNLRYPLTSLKKLKD